MPPAYAMHTPASEEQNSEIPRERLPNSDGRRLAAIRNPKSTDVRLWISLVVLVLYLSAEGLSGKEIGFLLTMTSYFPHVSGRILSGFSGVSSAAVGGVG